MPKPKIKGNLQGFSYDEAVEERKRKVGGRIGSAEVLETPSSVQRSNLRSKAMDRSMRYPAGSRLHGKELHSRKDVGAYLGHKYPTASMRRALREASKKPPGTVTPFSTLLYESAAKTAKKVGDIRRKNQRRKRFGLFGLGLTIASLGSSIKEAQKK